MYYYLISYYKELVLACFLLLAIAGSWLLLRGGGVRWKDIGIRGYHIFRGKGILNLFLCLLLMINLVLASAQGELGHSAVISLNYSNASQGLNPNGTRYNPTDILNDEVLERAIKKGGFEGVSAKELKNTLRVAPMVQAANEEEGQENYYVSTQFRLTYTADRHTSHLPSYVVVQMVAEAYKEWFVSEYSGNSSILDLDFETVNGNDYLDTADGLAMTAKEIGNYMTEMSYKEPAFQSSRNGETFGSLADSAYTIGDVMTENLEAHILENAVSREKGTYLGRLSFENQNLEFDAQKESMSNQNNLAAIQQYENDMARTVLVPTYDTEAQFYMSRTKIGVDDFAEAAEEHAAQMTSIRSEIAGNNYVFQMLSAQEASQGAFEKADALIGQIEEELTAVAEKAAVLVDEYNASQANRYMTIVLASPEAGLVKNLMKGVLYTLLLAAALHFARFAWETKNERKGGEAK